MREFFQEVATPHVWSEALAFIQASKLLDFMSTRAFRMCLIGICHY